VEIGIQRGEVTSDAIRQAKGVIEIEKASLAYTLAQDMIAEVKRDLGLIPMEGTVFEKKQAVTQAVIIPGTSETISHPIEAPTEKADPYNPSWTRIPKSPLSKRGTILPWHCEKCDNWYVSDTCPQCGELAPELKDEATQPQPPFPGQPSE